ncbi:type II toxin-antitoxin system HicB family antitoxin [Cupriavidus necator]
MLRRCGAIVDLPLTRHGTRSRFKRARCSEAVPLHDGSGQGRICLTAEGNAKAANRPRHGTRRPIPFARAQHAKDIALRAPASIALQGTSFAVSFPDLAGGDDGGETLQEAHEMAADALVMAMVFYVEAGRPVPLPSVIAPGQVWIELPPAASARVLRRNELAGPRCQPGGACQAFACRRG